MIIDLVNKKTLVIGKSGAGKSILIKYLLSQQAKDFQQIFLICPTERIKPAYSDYIKRANVFDSWNEVWSDKLFKTLGQMKKVHGDNMKPVLLILDDLGNDEAFHQSNIFKLMCTRGRHFNLSIIVALQYMNQVFPTCRSQFNTILVGQTNSQGVELLCKEFMFGTVNKKDFIDMYHENTKDRRFLAINCDSVDDNNDINQIYGSIKALI